MKTIGDKILWICVLAFGVCIKAIGDDFDSFYNMFKLPSKEYRPAPLYVWNTDVTPELINHTMNELHLQGFGGVFVHPRPGLKTEYLSDDWFSLFKHTLDIGKKLDMNVWIYDENTFPSGFAGGHVNAEMAESYNQGGSIALYQYDELPDKIENLFLILKEVDGRFIDVTANVISERGQRGKYYVYIKNFEPRVAWHGGYSYVDLLHSGVTQKFLDITSQGYENVALDEFGKNLPGWFTDEPHVGPPGGGIRWTSDLFDVFYKQWGYDLKSVLPSLSLDVGAWKKVRHNYYQTLLDLFIERWAKPCYEYCENHNLIFTGHYWEHAWPEIVYGPDNMAMYAWQHMPGIDMLMNQFNEDEPQAQFGNIRSVKEVRSVANQLGRKRVLCETYGASGWEERFEDFKRLGDWQAALGVNFMNQHLSHLSIAGDRKYDCPPSFSEHSPWWPYYKDLNNHYSRLSVAMSFGDQMNDILVIEPTTTVWFYYVTWASRPQLWNIGRNFQRFVTLLEKSQAEYDLGSEQVIKDNGFIQGNNFIVGKRGYSTVVIPPLTENLNGRTYELLKEFADNGGRILSFAEPTLIDGCENMEVLNFFKNDSAVIKLKELTPEVISKYFGSDEFQMKWMKGGNLFHQRRKLKDGEIIFLVNSDLEETSTGVIQVHGVDAVLLNTFTGEISNYPETIIDKNQLAIEYNIPPGGHLLLYVFLKGKSAFQTKELIDGCKVGVVPALSKMKCLFNTPNVLAIDFCDVKIGDSLYNDLHIYEADQKVFKYYGFPEGNPWGTAIQYKDNIVNRDTITEGGFEITYKFFVKDDVSPLDWKIVVERSELYDITLNGIKMCNQSDEWWIDREFNVLSIGKYIRKGENRLTLSINPMKLDAEPAPIYILGDFKLVSADHGWEIVASNDGLALGSWRQQGWPFYANSVTYTQEYMISPCDSTCYEIALEEWRGTVAEVLVNGVSAGIIAFKPYVLDVSKWIRLGKNCISVKVIGSNKNLFGPFHNSSSIGFVTPNLYKGTTVWPSGKEYLQLDYGLYKPFLLISKVE